MAEGGWRIEIETVRERKGGMKDERQRKEAEEREVGGEGELQHQTAAPLSRSAMQA